MYGTMVKSQAMGGERVVNGWWMGGKWAVNGW
jgi:hypothetical protein